RRMPRQRKIFAAVHSLRPGFSRTLFAGRIIVQDRGRHQRWRWTDAPPAAARRTLLLSVDRGEQLLHGARRRRTERLIEVDCLGPLLADEIIVACEFALASKRLFDAIGVAAAQRPCRVPRQQSFDLMALFIDRVHNQPRSIPSTYHSSSASRLRAYVMLGLENANVLGLSLFQRFSMVADEPMLLAVVTPERPDTVTGFRELR